MGVFYFPCLVPEKIWGKKIYLGFFIFGGKHAEVAIFA